MKYTKRHGAGNDYVYVDARSGERDWPEIARRMSDRHFGVGGYGLILIKDSGVADLKMSMFNADGSEAEMCGNGIRCFAKYVLERDIAQADDDGLRVETGRGVLTVEPRWEAGCVVGARVDMGEPELRWKEVPVNTYEAGPRDDRLLDKELVDHLLEKQPGGRLGSGADFIFFDGRLLLDGHGLVVTAVSMGNPHAVHFTDTPVAEYPLAETGPEVEYNMAFPHRVNFHVVNVLGRTRLRARTWERGAGITLACGTGACATGVASLLHGHTGEMVDVELPGGTLSIIWPGVGPVYLEGPAEEVFEGEWKG